MLTQYSPYLILSSLAVLLAGAFTFIAYFLGPKRANFDKQQPFETGLAYVPSSKQVHTHFYRVAMVFLLFDVEVVLLFPYVYRIKEWGWSGLALVSAFLFVLVLGIFYEQLQKMLKW